MDDSHPQPVDATHLWRLEEVADAAREIPLDEQPPRLRGALARLVEVTDDASAS
jgi:hypothetical protein